MERREEALEPAPSIIVTEKDGKGRAYTIGRQPPKRLFEPRANSWFSNQKDDVQQSLLAWYREQPGPSRERVQSKAAEVGASEAQIWTFVRNAQSLDAQEMARESIVAVAASFCPMKCKTDNGGNSTCGRCPLKFNCQRWGVEEEI